MVKIYVWKKPPQGEKSILLPSFLNPQVLNDLSFSSSFYAG